MKPPTILGVLTNISTRLNVLIPSDYFNMSYLASNVPYREIGGKGGARNRATISALQIARLP